MKRTMASGTGSRNMVGTRPNKPREKRGESHVKLRPPGDVVDSVLGHWEEGGLGGAKRKVRFWCSR